MTEEEIHYEQRKQPFNERLTEMILGRRKNIFEILYPGEELLRKGLRPICMQYNIRQKPKPSLGVAFYNLRTGKWLVIQPRHTIEMRSIVRGVYTESTLPLLMEQLYDDELRELADLESGDTFQKLFDRYYGTPLQEDLHNRLARGFWEKGWETLRNLARRLVAFREEGGFRISQWIFPKGRPLEGEEPFVTAKREVEEETGIKIIFENPFKSLPRVCRCGGRSRQDHHAEPSPETNMRVECWEPCYIDFPTDSEEFVPGFICREFVSHSHSDISGRIYKTTLWVCVFDLDYDPEIPLMAENYESRGGKWLSQEELFSQSRVVGLFHKCDSVLLKHYPYLTI